MMNKQLAFCTGGLSLALCLLALGGASMPVSAANANVAISQQSRTVTGVVTDIKGEP